MNMVITMRGSAGRFDHPLLRSFSRSYCHQLNRSARIYAVLQGVQNLSLMVAQVCGGEADERQLGMQMDQSTEIAGMSAFWKRGALKRVMLT